MGGKFGKISPFGHLPGFSPLPGEDNPVTGGKDGFKLLVIGETGAGKTSLLNLLANLHLFQDLDHIPLASKLELLKTYNNLEFENKGSMSGSKTNVAFPYKVDGLGMELVVVDTPGFGDTNGPEQQEANIASIMAVINAAEYVNAICLVVNGKQQKLTLHLAAVLDRMAMTLPKAVLKQLVVVFTNAKKEKDRLFDPSVLGEFLGAEIPQDHMMCMDNPVARIFTYQECAGLDEDDLEELTKSLKTTVSSLAALFRGMASFEPKNTRSFMQVYEAKQVMEKRGFELMQQFQKTLDAEVKQNEYQRDFEFQEQREEGAKLNLYVQEDPVEEDYRQDTDYHNMICEQLDCRCNCHEKCDIPFSTDKSSYQGRTGCLAFAHASKSLVIRTEPERVLLFDRTYIVTCTRYITSTDFEIAGRNECGMCGDELSWVVAGDDHPDPSQHQSFRIDGRRLGGQYISHFNCCISGSFKSKKAAENFRQVLKDCPLPHTIEHCWTLDWEDGMEQKCNQCGHELKHHAHQKYKWSKRRVTPEPKINPNMMKQFNEAKTLKDQALVGLKSVKKNLAEINDKKGDISRQLLRNLRHFERITAGRGFPLVLNQQKAYYEECIKTLIEQGRSEESVKSLRQTIKQLEALTRGIKHGQDLGLVDATGIDTKWALKMTNTLREVDTPATVDDAVLRLDAVNVDVNELKALLLHQRDDWTAEGHLENKGLPLSMMDHVLVIYANTLQNPPVFKQVCGVLHDQDARVKTNGEPSAKVMACLPYSKFLDEAVDKLPPTLSYKGTAYRGLRGFVFSDLEARFPEGKVICWYECKSVTYDRNVILLDDFCGLSGDRTIYEISDFEGKKIEGFSFYPEERELIAPCLSVFKVTGVRKGTMEHGNPFTYADIIYLKMEHDISRSDWAEVAGNASHADSQASGGYPTGA